MNHAAHCAFVLSLLALPALAADPSAGRALFRQQCAICHTAEPLDNGGGQGPALTGIFGRPAASNSAFSYTQAMSNSKLTWDAATLDRFLESPTSVVPGGAMVIAVPQPAQRADLIAYFESVSKNAAPSPTATAAQPTPAAAKSTEGADWRLDRPGRMHRIDVETLPAPFETPSASNRPKIVARPKDAHLSLPAGFGIDVFASDLLGPRKMLVAANGDVLVSEMYGGRVTVLHLSADGATAGSRDVFAEGLKQPFGLAFYPDAEHPRWLYVAETNRIVRFAYRTGDLKAAGAPEVVVAQLPSGAGHVTRDLVFAPNGERMFVSVGSGSNVADGMSKKSPKEVRAWEAKHGLGAAWDAETNRAAVLVFNVNSKKRGKLFATGIRNCVTLTVQPATGALWCTTNERDQLGDDLVPDYSTRVVSGAFYGWPWYYLGSHEDPRHAGERPDLRGKVSVPDVLFKSHSAPLNLTFYTAKSGSAAFPADYVGDAFVTFHGSWNRSFRTGHKIVRLRMKDGVPTGDYEDFLTGFIVDDADVWGRPVATTVLKDGSLLLSDDGANLIYRIAYSR